MTIEDMVASFSGDAFAKPEPPPVTLFDVEEEPEEEPDMMLDVPTLHEDHDGLLAESEMTSSLYGPIGSLMDGGDEMDEDDDPDFAPDTAESFLEEEMGILQVAQTEFGQATGHLSEEGHCSTTDSIGEE